MKQLIFYKQLHLVKMQLYDVVVLGDPVLLIPFQSTHHK